jgi:hypothetical protein
MALGGAEEFAFEDEGKLCGTHRQDPESVGSQKIRNVALHGARRADSLNEIRVGSFKTYFYQWLDK